MALIALEVPSGSTMIVLHRPDGSTTVQVEPDIVEEASRRYHQSLGPIHWPPTHLLHEPAELT